MKHPLSGEFMMPVPSHLEKKLLALGNASYIEQEDIFWTTAEVMSKLVGVEYFIVNENFDPVVRVDFERREAFCDERGGWSRTYSRTFDELQELAIKYETIFDLSAEKKSVAEMAYKLIYAEEMRHHGSGFDKFFPVPTHRFLPQLPVPEVDGMYFTKDQMLDYGEKCRKQDEDEDES